jgi:hypothetical protein
VVASTQATRTAIAQTADVKMKVQPNENYFLTTDKTVCVDKTKIYDAIPATDLPDYEKKGLVRVNGLILQNFMYTVIEP